MVRASGLVLLVLVAVVLPTACDSGSKGGGVGDGSDVIPAETTAVPLTPSAVAEGAEGMVTTVGTSMEGAEYFHDETWHLHYGDGLMFGPSWDLAAWTLDGEESHHDRAIAALETNLVLVEEASANLLGSLDDLESIAMALMGLLESGQYIDEPRYLDAATILLGQVDTMAQAAGDYMEIDAGEFAADTYGPTSLTSFIALAHLERVLAAPGDPTAAEHKARAAAILDAVHAAAWDAEASVYRFAPDDARLMLYPNATMMGAYGRAYQVIGDAVYLDRMAGIWTGIQGLRAASGDHYHSPYSFEEMGATDEDYTTLSSQNYLMLGLWLAHIGSGELHYLEDIESILGWLESHLLVDGVILHHWIDHRPADETDPYDFCSGCNLQLLYIVSVIELYVAGD